jgi:hypothetical protein
MYVVEDLDGYWAYLTHPAHVGQEMEGIPLIEKFAAIDVTDSDDPRSAKRSPGCRPATCRSPPSWPYERPRRPRSRCPASPLRPADRRRPDHVAPQR